MENTTELTPLQSAFAVAFATNGGNGTAAAKEAGYAEASARVLAHRLVRNPAVQASIREHQWRLVNGSLTAASLAVLRRALDLSDDSVPWGVRLDAVKVVTSAAGLTLSENPDIQPPADAARADLSSLLGRLVQARDMQARKDSAIDLTP